MGDQSSITRDDLPPSCDTPKACVLIRLARGPGCHRRPPCDGIGHYRPDPHPPLHAQEINVANNPPYEAKDGYEVAEGLVAALKRSYDKETPEAWLGWEITDGILDEFEVGASNGKRYRVEVEEIPRKTVTTGRRTNVAALLNLSYDMRSGPPVHPMVMMRQLSIVYLASTPQSMGDQWWFWSCKNVPDPLPDYLTLLDMQPHEAIGFGLSQEDADYIIENSLPRQ